MSDPTPSTRSSPFSRQVLFLCVACIVLTAVNLVRSRGHIWKHKPRHAIAAHLPRAAKLGPNVTALTYPPKTNGSFLFEKSKRKPSSGIPDQAITDSSLQQSQLRPPAEDVMVGQNISTSSREYRHRNFSCPWNNSTWTFPSFPRLIILGAQKAGTTAIGQLLRNVPNLLGSRGMEPHFFDWNVGVQSKFTPVEKCKLLHQYLAKFDEEKIGPETIVFEKTPSYLSMPQKAGPMYGLLEPHPPKLVVMLRDPIARYYSWYKMDWQNSPRKRKENTYPSVEASVSRDVELLRRHRFVHAPPLTNGNITGADWNQSEFEIGSGVLEGGKSFMNAIARGFYSAQIRGYMKYFPLGSSLRVYQYEYFLKNKNASMNDILEFVGADPYNFTDKEVNKQLGPIKPQKSHEYPHMDRKTREYLKRLYKPFNDELADLLGEDWRGVWD